MAPRFVAFKTMEDGSFRWKIEQVEAVKNKRSKANQCGWVADSDLSDNDKAAQLKFFHHMSMRISRDIDDDGPHILDEEPAAEVLLGRRPMKRVGSPIASVPKQSKKRKTEEQSSLSTCLCLAHQSTDECENDSYLKRDNANIDIMAKIVCYSDTVIVFVGNDEQTFNVHKDLLCLHSTYFRNWLHGTEDTKLCLPGVEPLCFADFTSWIYSGAVLKTGKSGERFSNLQSSPEKLYYLGTFLKAPAFCNYVIDSLRHMSRTQPNHRISPQNVREAYRLSRDGSLLRIYSADLLNLKNPFKILEEGSDGWKEWKALFRELPDLMNDMITQARRTWEESYPWSPEHRKLYMEVEDDTLETKWRKHILSERSERLIELTSGEGRELELVASKDIREIIESDHIATWSGE